MKVVVTDLRLHSDGNARCGWCGDDEDYVAYHDAEWGVGATSDNEWYEKVCLEGFQSGLSWITILRRRAAFREVFANFDPDVVATFTDFDVERLVLDERIIRHRGKISSTINNAKRALELRAEFGSLDAFLRTMSSLISTSHMRSSMCQHKPIRHAPSQKNCGAGVGHLWARQRCMRWRSQWGSSMTTSSVAGVETTADLRH